MEGIGPAYRTRSTKSSTEVEIDSQSDTNTNKIGDFSSEESEALELKTPSKIKRRKNKPRTPSGQLMSSSVEDIRNYLLGRKDRANSVPEIYSETLTPGQNRLARYLNSTSQSQSSVNQSGNKEELLGHKGAKPKYCNNKQEEVLGDLSDTQSKKDQRKQRRTKQPQTGEDYIDESRMMKFFRMENAFTQRMHKKSEINGKIKQLEKDKNAMAEKIRQYEAESSKEIDISLLTQTGLSEEDVEKTQTMNVKLVMEMFQQIRKEIKGSAIPEGKSRVDDLEIKNELIIGELQNVTHQLEDVKVRNQILSNTVIHMSDEIQHLHQRLNNVELNNMKQSLVVTGIHTTRKKSDCIAHILDFMYTEMEVQPDIRDVFFTNSQSTSPLIIKLGSMEDKLEILQNTPKLKGLVNEFDQSFFFSDQLPPEINESRRRKRDIFRVNQRAEENEKKDMTWKQGRLQIGEEVYRKKVETPTEKSIVSMSMEEMEKAFAIKLDRGKEIKLQGSTFIGYSPPVNTYEQVNNAYVKMKLVHGDARHIICAYRIPGITSYNDNDYCDNGEHGAGRQLLKWMEQNKINARAIFVIRYYGGQKLGPKRFECITQAACHVIKNAIPDFQVADTQQWPETTRNNPEQRKTAPPRKQRIIKRKYGVSQSRRRGSRYLNPWQGRGRGASGSIGRGNYQKDDWESEGGEAPGSEWPRLQEQ